MRCLPNFLVPSKRIKSVTTGKSYKIRQSLSCRTDYVIYCAICTLCNKQCVGSSIKFRSRLSNHKSHIKKNKITCRLVNHFIDNSCSHNLSDLKFILIEQVTTKTEKFLEYREGYWQAQLWTYEPYGFNAKKNSIRGDVANFWVDFLIRTPSSWRLFRCHGDKILDLGIRKGMISTSSWVLRFILGDLGDSHLLVRQWSGWRRRYLWNNIFYPSKLLTLLFHFHSFIPTIQSACYLLP